MLFDAASCSLVLLLDYCTAVELCILSFDVVCKTKKTALKNSTKFFMDATLQINLKKTI